MSRVWTKTYSSQPRRKVKVATAISPLLTCGRTTMRKAWKRVAPSVTALISMSQGTLSKKPLRTKIAKGNSSALMTSTTPKRLLSSPM
ncbi:hypothetical protein D3C78_1375550 [compost metagenome]